MSEKQLAMIREHVWQRDYPEAQASWIEMASTAGFQQSRCGYRDKQEMYTAFEFGCS